MDEKIISVGIDIGTTTTQLVFSSIIMRNTASQYSVPRIEIIEKKVIYRSDIYFTPLIDQGRIDSKRVREIVEREYGNAGLLPQDISTGAIIITGETAHKENAALVLKSLSGFAGEFVVATAGPYLESIIAGKGSGTEQLSKDEECVAINLDIGGGTTNIAVFRNGKVIDTACLDIGARLVKLRRGTEIVEYIAPKIKNLLKISGIDLSENQPLSIEKSEAICKQMVRVIEEVLGLLPKSKALDIMLTGRDLKRNYSIDYITFSGGVADYIYNPTDKEVYKYDDLGILLGNYISKSIITERIKPVKPRETIRATVVGAGAHTVEISGSTITYTKDCFPLKNIPIIKMPDEDESGDMRNFQENIMQHLNIYDLEQIDVQFAVALNGIKNPSFVDVVNVADKILDGVGDYLKNLDYLIVVIENDMAKALGQTLYSKLKGKWDIICIDNISVENGDYIDIGKPMGDGRVVPVVIKTLIFNF